MMSIRTRRSTGLWGLLLALGLLAAPVAAQETTDARLARIRSELPTPVVQQIEASVETALQEGLPIEPLLDKAVEGIAKGVPGNRIATAVQQVARELHQARIVLRNGAPPSPTEVAAVADAIRRGVPEPTIRRLAERAGPQEPMALAVHTLGDLMDRGVPADQALTVLEAWRHRGSRAEDLRELPGAVERLIRQGIMPEQAAEAVAGAMRAGGPPSQAGMQRGMRGQGKPPGTPPIPPGAGAPGERGQEKPPHGKPPGGGGTPPGGG